jgi:hypothetical protein
MSKVLRLMGEMGEKSEHERTRVTIVRSLEGKCQDARPLLAHHHVKRESLWCQNHEVSYPARRTSEIAAIATLFEV